MSAGAARAADDERRISPPAVRPARPPAPGAERASDGQPPDRCDHATVASAGRGPLGAPSPAPTSLPSPSGATSARSTSPSARSASRASAWATSGKTATRSASDHRAATGSRERWRRAAIGPPPVRLDPASYSATRARSALRPPCAGARGGLGSRRHELSPSGPPGRVVSGRDPRRRGEAARAARSDLALLRRRRAELRDHEGRPQAHRRHSASFGRSRSTSAPTTCSPPATARRRSSGAAPTRTPRTPRAGRSTTGRGSTASSTPTSSAACGPYVEIGFMPKALSTQARPLPARVAARAAVRRDLHRLGLPARRTTRSGRSSSTDGPRTASSGTGRPRWRRWYWETWNEANIGYWSGTPEEFLKLHDHADGRGAASASRSAGSAGRTWRAPTRSFCGPSSSTARDSRSGTPLDFVAFHAKGVAHATWTATCAWASPPSSRRSSRASRRSRPIPS